MVQILIYPTRQRSVVRTWKGKGRERRGRECKGRVEFIKATGTSESVSWSLA